jgi:hypothetical protein
LWVIIAEILELPPSLYSVGKIFTDFLFCDIMNLSAQLSETTIIVPEAFSTLLLESSEFHLSTWMREDSHEAATKSPLKIVLAPNRPGL